MNPSITEVGHIYPWWERGFRKGNIGDKGVTVSVFLCVQVRHHVSHIKVEARFVGVKLSGSDWGMGMSHTPHGCIRDTGAFTSSTFIVWKSMNY